MTPLTNLKKCGPGYKTISDLVKILESYFFPKVELDADASSLTGRKIGEAAERVYEFTYDAAAASGDDITVQVPLTQGHVVDKVTDLFVHDSTVGLLPAALPTSEYVNVSVGANGVITIGASAGVTLGGGNGRISFTEVLD